MWTYYSLAVLLHVAAQHLKSCFMCRQIFRVLPQVLAALLQINLCPTTYYVWCLCRLKALLLNLAYMGTYECQSQACLTVIAGPDRSKWNFARSMHVLCFVLFGIYRKFFYHISPLSLFGGFRFTVHHTVCLIGDYYSHLISLNISYIFYVE